MLAPCHSTLSAPSINIQGDAATHSYWTGNLGQTARRREPELSGEERERQDIKGLFQVLSWRNVLFCVSNFSPGCYILQPEDTVTFRSYLRQSRFLGAGSGLEKALYRQKIYENACEII